MLVPGILQRRSSWPSSFVTGLIGWNGFAIIVPMALGYSGSLGPLFLAATCAAVLQVLMLRLAFSRLRMDRSLIAGAFWGGLTAALLVLTETAIFEVVSRHPLVSIAIGVYVGIPVGVFLSYFHRDDREIEEAAGPGVDINYGRDAHWLDPFVYGAVCHLVAFMPATVGVAISSATVGSIVGVVAAGVSHFFLSKWKNAVWTIPVAALGGACLGVATGFLFRNYQQQLWLPYLGVGSLAGMLTFAVTSVVGRKLGLQEETVQQDTTV